MRIVWLNLPNLTSKKPLSRCQELLKRQRNRAVESKQINSWLFILPLKVVWNVLELEVKTKQDILCFWSAKCWVLERSTDPHIIQTTLKFKRPFSIHSLTHSNVWVCECIVPSLCNNLHYQSHCNVLFIRCTLIFTAASAFTTYNSTSTCRIWDTIGTVSASYWPE